MVTLIERKLKNFPAECIDDEELVAILGVGGEQKHGSVKREVLRGDLIHVRCGLY